MAQAIRTQADVGKVYVPAGKAEVVVPDKSKDKARGLVLRVRPGGSRKWVFMYRDSAGAQRKFSVGDANPTTEARPDSLTLSEAQAKVRTYRGEVERGEQPGATDTAKLIENTRQAPSLFGTVVDRYLAARNPDAPIAKMRLRPRAHVECTRHLRVHLKPLHDLPIEGLTRKHIVPELERIAADAPSTADKVRSTLSAMFAWAIEREDYSGDNPVALIKPLDEYKPRDRVLSDAELASVWRAADPMTPYGRIVRLLILTGQRRDEIGSLRWSEIEAINDPGRALVALPAERTKNGTPHKFPLSATALDVLALCRAQDREFVFSRTDAGFSAWSKNKIKLDAAAAALTDFAGPWTLHDLRRTCRTGLSRLGVLPHTAEAVLNHLPPKIQRTYNLDGMEAAKRTALATWADHVALIVAKADASNVVDLPRRA